MKRRKFLSFLAISSSIPLFGSGIFQVKDISKYRNEFNTIESLQEFLFPSDNEYLGAKDFNAIGYLKVMSEFRILKDNEINYLIQGANEFDFTVRSKYKKSFQELDKYEKEKFFKFYINRGSKKYRWVNMIKTHTLYALMSDPIYGGNKNQTGWKWLNVKTPNPRPQTRMGK